MKTRKIFVVLLCVLCSLFVFTACSNSGNSSSGSNEKEEKKTYKVGETWTVDGQWEVTITGFTETADRNQYSDKNPGAVYIVDFTWKNIGYNDEYSDGLYISMDDSIVDCKGVMGYSYPGNITNYPQETPVGAVCNGQVCIGVDNAGTPITLNVSKYDANSKPHKATFILQ